MSPKTKPTRGKKEKKAPVAAKEEKKVSKAKAPVVEVEEILTEAETPAIDPDELEEREEAEEASAHSSGNAAALAAAAGSPTEMSASFKNFRHHPDMENFYRFIYENDLRHEALAIIDEVMNEKHHKKQGKGSK